LLTLPSRSPTRQALRHRPRHHLQPRSLPRCSRPCLRRHLPPCPSRQLKGGVRQVKGSCLCCRRLGDLPRWIRRPIIWCWCSDQCYRNSQLQGCCVPRIFDLHGQLCSFGKFHVVFLFGRSVEGLPQAYGPTTCSKSKSWAVY
jgi:hypothetical protein